METRVHFSFLLMILQKNKNKKEEHLNLIRLILEWQIPLSLGIPDQKVSRPCCLPEESACSVPLNSSLLLCYITENVKATYCLNSKKTAFQKQGGFLSLISPKLFFKRAEARTFSMLIEIIKINIPLDPSNVHCILLVNAYVCQWVKYKILR